MSLLDSYTTTYDKVVKAKRLLFQHLHSMKIFTVKPEQVHVLHADGIANCFKVLFYIDKEYYRNELYELCYEDNREENSVIYNIKIYRMTYTHNSKIDIEQLTNDSD